MPQFSDRDDYYLNNDGPSMDSQWGGQNDGQNGPIDTITVTGTRPDNTNHGTNWITGLNGVRIDTGVFDGSLSSGGDNPIQQGMDQYDTENTFFQKIQDKLVEKWQQLTDKSTYDPVKLTKAAVKEITGYDVDTGKWDPTGLASTIIAATGVGGVASLISGITGMFKWAGGEMPTIDIRGAILGSDKVNKNGEFIPANPDTTHPGTVNNPTIGNTPQTVNEIVPVFKDDGGIDEIIVTGPTGQQFHVTPDDISNWGLKYGQLPNIDFTQLFTTGEVVETLPPELPAPPKVNQNPNDVAEIVVNGRPIVEPGPDITVPGSGQGGQMTDGSGQTVNTNGDIPIVEGGTPPEIVVGGGKKKPSGPDDTNLHLPGVMIDGSGQTVNRDGDIPIVEGGTPPEITIGGTKPDDTDRGPIRLPNPDLTNPQIDNPQLPDLKIDDGHYKPIGPRPDDTVRHINDDPPIVNETPKIDPPGKIGQIMPFTFNKMPGFELLSNDFGMSGQTIQLDGRVDQVQKPAPKTATGK